jgi:2'-5' RNA ligase
VAGSLFAGWRPGADGHGVLAAAQDALLAACPPGGPRPRPRRPDQWHVTLCFIRREGDEATFARAARALAAVPARIPAHSIVFERVAYWRRSGAVVAVPRHDAVLQALCDACATALQAAGIKPEGVTTEPHATLAFLPRALPPQHWLDDVAVHALPVRVDRFELLANVGGLYAPVADWRLPDVEAGGGD